MKLSRLPLTALRSFEAAGRLQSFTLAAEELFVSQAAISRQIRELEDRIGLALFTRHHRHVELTPAGARLLETLTSSFSAIANRMDSLCDLDDEIPVTVSAEPGFAACCLLPRLGRFHEAYPNIVLSIDSETKVVDFRNSDVELALRFSFSKTSWPGVESRKLIDSPLSPVLAPGLMSDASEIREAIEKREITIIHDESRDAWRLWLEAAGMNPDLAALGPHFTDTNLVVQAALRGQGIVNPGLAVVRDDLAAGRLVQPFDIEIKGSAYYVVAPSFQKLRPQARAFVNWLLAEFPSS